MPGCVYLTFCFAAIFGASFRRAASLWLPLSIKYLFERPSSSIRFMFPFFDAIFHTPPQATVPLPRQLFSLCFVISLFYALFTLFSLIPSLSVFSFFSARMFWFSCPFVLFMMINFIAHFLWISCVGCAYFRSICSIWGEISMWLSPYNMWRYLWEAIYDDPKSISSPSDGISSALGIYVCVKINPNWIICHLRLLGNFL